MVLLGGCGLSCRAQPSLVCDVGAEGPHAVATKLGTKAAQGVWAKCSGTHPALVVRVRACPWRTRLLWEGWDKD